ncbi:hypothetical protein Hypma_009564 [Hypsizygus marmoreus]|uniref:Uncharacterized protein n=1 Tax=Hypsizygus marmoreus TaxID=39966 RepID=A0A369JM41_HYPMA|nr:hypothetical protein Hypma_009564 [Hypsizygus marmoreus]
MPICSLYHHAFTPVVHSVTRNPSHQLLRFSRRSTASLSLTLDTFESTPNIETPSTTPRNFLRERKLEELRDSLDRKASPTRVWSHYTALLNVVGYEKLPKTLHQEVLKLCSASNAELRVSAARRLVAGNKPTSPHIHEGRFRTVIRNIRAMDVTPDLEDYHFILEQFAAVGHHVGAIQVYKEIKHVGLEPRTKTFGLCLQAIAHRLTLPVSPAKKANRTAETRQMIADLMSDMRNIGIPFTSANLDLTIRILKETLDEEGFENLMKWGYGIDLANPDRPPLEYLGSGTISSDLGMSRNAVPGLPTPQPFSTAALNTTIDMLGRFGNVSRMVQAFEVLTQPLPRAGQHLFTSFDDDDDFGVADGPPTTTFIPPHAKPNTTTYNMLLRHLCKAGHTILARHYLVEAIHLDRDAANLLKRNFFRVPLDKLHAPHFAINRGTLLPVFGESNRDKNLGLLRWLTTKLPTIMRWKRERLAFYAAAREHIKKQRPTPSESSPPSPINPRTPSNKPHSGSVFDVDLNADPTPSSPPPVKIFDVDLHVRILERDVEEIEAFSKHAHLILGRTTQRVKERLGRRVWNGKDIYLSMEDARMKVEREKWVEIVRFQPRLNSNHSSRIPSVRSRGNTSADGRPFSTFFQSNMSATPPLDEAAQPDTPQRGILTHIGSMLQHHRR